MNDSFNLLMYGLPIEIGNKIFNYILPSLGQHRKKMKKMNVDFFFWYEILQGRWNCYDKSMYVNYAEYEKDMRYERMENLRDFYD